MVKKLKKYFSKETIIFIAITLLFYILWGTVSLFCDKNNSLTNSVHPIYAVIMNLFDIPFTNAYAATWVQFLVFMFLIFVTTLVFGIILIYLLKNHQKITWKYYVSLGGSFLISCFVPILLSFARSFTFSEASIQYVTFTGTTFLMTLITLVFLVPVLLFIYFIIYVLKKYVFTKKVFGDTSLESNKITLDNGDIIDANEEIFVGLKNIDNNFTSELFIQDNELTLKEIADRFRNYLAVKHELYFDIKIIRAFIGAFSASRLIILEGLSGTGKSSLPRYFSEFINEEAFFAPVQATWRDRTNLLGYYNDFSKTFKETDFLCRLYNATYSPNHLNIMVLDELNLSRIEYYFADFISILEYPCEEWKITLMHLPQNYVEPEHLTNGVLKINENTFFVGTANKDDSTYLITDKVYDRAMVLDFEDRNEPFEVIGESDSISLSYTRLMELFKDAQNNKEYQFNKEDYEKFRKICDFTYETFDITFGNRIMNQIKDFVPAFVSLGGTKEEALDIMFSKKILRKVEGRYEDYIYNGLSKLLNLINKTYGKGVFTLTERAITNLLKKVK